MPWTKQQQKVIDQRDADILVSAAAGSGKTAVLVERIIQKITDEKQSDRCGSSACRDIYESSSRGDERKDYGGT